MYKGSAVYIIGEAGVNHNGSLARALELVDAAKDAGVDAVKFQTFTPEKVISRIAPKAEYQYQTTGAVESQLDMVRKLKLTDADHFALVARCEERGIEFLSSPFDEDAVDFLLHELKVTRVKIPSGEITNAPYLLRIARGRRPMMLSTGMSTLADIKQALGVIAFGLVEPVAPPSLRAFAASFDSDAGQAALREFVSLLHCVTEYPSPLAETNLRAMDTMRGAFGLPVGYSDHTLGFAACAAAVARGAVIIEKHFTLDKTLPGPDHKASLEPDELSAMVVAIRETELSLGSPEKAPTASELKNMPIARKSLIAARDIAKGELFTTDNLVIKRPGSGISPLLYWDFLGRAAEHDYNEDDLIR